MKKLDIGSAHQWVEIPNVTSGELALSSLRLGGRVERHQRLHGNENLSSSVELRIGHKFSAADYPAVPGFIYNAAFGGRLETDLGLQVQY